MIKIDLNDFKYIFWDFDGVIKESVNIKTEAFKKLFNDEEPTIISKISEHHLENGGLSRFEKIPLYLGWSNKEKNEELIKNYLDKFSDLVVQAVIDSKWVDGVKEFIDQNYRDKYFFLITGTPQNEIEIILNQLGIKKYFQEIIGSPSKKDMAVNSIITKNNIELSSAVFIGDSMSDYNAAIINRIQFILRTHEWNVNLSKSLKCFQISSFL